MKKGGRKLSRYSEERASPGRRGMKAGDAVLVALVVIAAGAAMFVLASARAGQKGSTALVEVNGREVKRVELEEGMGPRRMEVQGFVGTSVIEFRDCRARMVESACRDKLCVGMGWVGSGGESIVCLPNRVVVRITSEPTGVDTVTE